MKVKIAPSILSADFSKLGEEVKRLEECGADLVHCDVMDGSFVAPITFGAQTVKAVRPLTRLPLDVHLMIEHPKTQIKFFADAGADIITVHYGACAKISKSYLAETLNLIKSFNVKCGVVINPDVPAENIYSVLPLCDMVLAMSVFPGYGGQKYIDSVTEKIAKLRSFVSASGLDTDIEVDGGITVDNCKTVLDAGANVLVAGSAVFNSDNMAVTIAKLRGI